MSASTGGRGRERDAARGGGHAKRKRRRRPAGPGRPHRGGPVRGNRSCCSGGVAHAADSRRARRWELPLPGGRAADGR
eukprot:7905756-Alexandrium_andersonii.AAC.1